MDERRLLSRRALLGGVGALALTSLLPRERARAGVGGPPKRFVVVHVPEGMWTGAVRPVAGEATLGPILGPLDPFRSHVTVLDGLNVPSRAFGPGGGGHFEAMLHMLTGIESIDISHAGGPSVDQRIAEIVGGETRFRSLQFGIHPIHRDVNAKPIWSAPGRAVPAMRDPWEAYRRIFAGSMTSERIDLRRSALDFALEETRVLRDRLSPTDRDRLDSYQESLRRVETRLDAPAPVCAPPVLGEPIDAALQANVPEIGRLQTDLLVAALQCDLTRVASLQWSNSNDQWTYGWIDVDQSGHNLAHNNNNCDPTGAKKTIVYNWYATQFAYLLERLRSVPEGDGTMLDNTLVLWVTEFGNSNGHGGSNMLWTLMGNAGGYFRTGDVVPCRGRSVNDLYVSLIQAMGGTDTTFGNPDYCTEPLLPRP
jgi:hypothetical protein